MFKKKFTLFQQIEQRVIQSLKQQIPFAEKRIHKIYFPCLTISIIMFLNFMFVYCGYNYLHLNIQLVNFFILLNGLFTLAIGQEYLSNFISLKKCAKMLRNYNDEFYLSLFKRNEKDGFSQLNQLTKEEIQQLFDLELTTTQLEFLQKIIINQGYLNLDHLAQCPELSIDEEKNILQEHQQKLNEFFSNNSVINSKYQQLVDQMNDYQEQEQTLTSRL